MHEPLFAPKTYHADAPRRLHSGPPLDVDWTAHSPALAARVQRRSRACPHCQDHRAFVESVCLSWACPACGAQHFAPALVAPVPSGLSLDDATLRVLGGPSASDAMMNRWFRTAAAKHAKTELARKGRGAALAATIIPTASYTMGDVAKVMNVDRRTVANLCDRGELTALRTTKARGERATGKGGTHRRVLGADLIAYLLASPAENDNSGGADALTA